MGGWVGGGGGWVDGVCVWRGIIGKAGHIATKYKKRDGQVARVRAGKDVGETKAKEQEFERVTQQFERAGGRACVRGRGG